MRTLAVLAFLAATAIVAASQEQPRTQPPQAETAAAAEQDPMSAYYRRLYRGLTTILLRSAEQMPEEHYSFRPTAEVRSFGQIVGHLADSQYFFCAPVRGEANPRLNIEKTRTSKAELLAALREAFAYCGKAYAELTEADGKQMVTVMGGPTPRMGALATNAVHSALHYGNLTTYMRMKGQVPPSSDPELMERLRRPPAD